MHKLVNLESSVLCIVQHINSPQPLKKYPVHIVSKQQHYLFFHCYQPGWCACIVLCWKAMPCPHMWRVNKVTRREYSLLWLTFNTSAVSCCAASMRGVLPLRSATCVGSGNSERIEWTVLADPVITAQWRGVALCVFAWKGERSVPSQHTNSTHTHIPYPSMSVSWSRPPHCTIMEAASACPPRQA